MLLVTQGARDPPLKKIIVTRVGSKVNIEVAYVINGSNTSQYLGIAYDDK